MATVHENKSSLGSDAEMKPGSIIEESADFSAELKLSEHSTGHIPRKASKASSAGDSSTDNKSNMRRITEVLNNSGIEDELSSLPPTNTDSRRKGSVRDSDFHYTGNSGIVNFDGEQETKWDKAKQEYKKLRTVCGKIVNNATFQYFIVVCILINALMMGAATYVVNKEKENLVDYTFYYADLGFLIIFTFELLFHAIYHGPRMFLDGWLIFDILVIVPSWFSYRYGGDGAPSFQVLRGFRVFRALRLVTRIQRMKDLVVALLSVMPRMFAIILMLLLIFYIFAVMFTQLYSTATYAKGHEKEGQPIIYFESLEQSMLTLFQLMTMDEWATIVRDLLPEYPLAWLYMICFVIISGFIVVNLIVAVICDAIGSLSDTDKSKLQGRYDDDDSATTKMELRDQIDTIEDQIGDLTRIQARTFHTLQYLTQQLQVEKEKSAGVLKAAPAEENTRRNSGDSKDKRANLMKKSLSSERSRRKGFAQTGFVSKRKNFTDTWTQEGSDKTLRRAMVTNFAKSARELQKMRDREETNFANSDSFAKSDSQFAKSLRNLQAMREEEEKVRKEEMLKEVEKMKTFE